MSRWGGSFSPTVLLGPMLCWTVGPPLGGSRSGSTPLSMSAWWSLAQDLLSGGGGQGLIRLSTHGVPCASYKQGRGIPEVKGEMSRPA